MTYLSLTSTIALSVACVAANWDVVSVKLKWELYRVRYRGIHVYNICLISISNLVSEGATDKSFLNIERA